MGPEQKDVGVNTNVTFFPELKSNFVSLIFEFCDNVCQNWMKEPAVYM